MRISGRSFLDRGKDQYKGYEGGLCLCVLGTERKLVCLEQHKRGECQNMKSEK